ncbi:MAG: hypothetical protein WCJ93_05510 [Methanomicrobiales archaeon]
MRGTKKSVICVSLMVLICVSLMATVSATTIDFGKSNQFFIQKPGLNPVLGNAGSNDLLKAMPHPVYPVSFAIIKPQANAPYIRKIGSYNPVPYYGYQVTLPVSYPTITPVPEQSSSNSKLGGLIIRGQSDGDLINIRSNFFDASTGPTGIYNGKWHYNYWSVPVYWENQVLPGSYTIQIANKTSGVVYYSQTVTVLPGQTTVIPADGLGLCPFCSSY